MEDIASSKKTMAGCIQLLNECEAGHLDNLECPVCRRMTVSVWFTNPAEDSYRTWFLCADCGFHTRVQNTSKPRYYGEERRRIDLEERGAAILKVAKFPKPR